MKKKIFIGIHYLELGGAEISLIGLLQTLDYSKVEVDLFIYSHQGPLMNFIPKEVRLLPEIKPYSLFERPIMSVVKKGYLFLAVTRIYAKILNNKYACSHKIDGMEYCGTGFVGKYVSKVMPDLFDFGEYDLAISFLTPHNFVIDHIHAKKKICWIHTDYSKVAINPEVEFPVWSSYDNIVSISSDVTRSFIRVFPSLYSKIIEIENILSSEFVLLRAIEFEPDLGDTGNCFKLLTIGRFVWQKNMDNVSCICKKILNAGYNVKWFLIGYGPDENLIRAKIVEAGMQNNVIILGKKENPYPYIKACDIYVQPSRYEGKSVTVREAQMLCKPVVVTNYPTASSQIQDGVDGVIVPMDNEGCANGIAELILDKVKQKQIIEYLQAHDYGNEAEVEKIYKLLEQ